VPPRTRDCRTTCGSDRAGLPVQRPGRAGPSPRGRRAPHGSEAEAMARPGHVQAKKSSAMAARTNRAGHLLSPREFVFDANGHLRSGGRSLAPAEEREKSAEKPLGSGWAYFKSSGCSKRAGGESRGTPCPGETLGGPDAAGEPGAGVPEAQRDGPRAHPESSRTSHRPARPTTKSARTTYLGGFALPRSRSVGVRAGEGPLFLAGPGRPDGF